MTNSTELRLRMLQAAEMQLAASGSDISTRAVCEAVGVGQPVLYRLFGDKAGLMSALVDRGYDRFIERKRHLAITDDPVADLRAGWNDHIAFAVENPAIYRLMFSPTLGPQISAPRALLDLLTGTLERCAQAGVLLVSPALAAQRIRAACTGVALAILSRPDLYSDPDLSDSVRDSVFASCIGVSVQPPADRRLAGTAVQLAALLREGPASALGSEEQCLLLKWLDALGG